MLDVYIIEEMKRRERERLTRGAQAPSGRDPRAARRGTDEANRRSEPDERPRRAAPSSPSTCNAWRRACSPTPCARCSCTVAGRPLRIAWDEAYRLPLAPVETGPAPLETRRADDALFYLMEQGAVTEDSLLAFGPGDLRPARAGAHHGLARGAARSGDAGARVRAREPRDVVVDELLKTLRMAVGGTVAAARLSVKERVPALQPAGRLPPRGAGQGRGLLRAQRRGDAVAALRAGRLRAGAWRCWTSTSTRPTAPRRASRTIAACGSARSPAPTGGRCRTWTRRCCRRAPATARTSTRWTRCSGACPTAGVVFVLAGGDVVAGDRLGLFALSLQGIRERDRRVAEKLAGAAAGVAAGRRVRAARLEDRRRDGAGARLGQRRTRFPSTYDPLALRMGRIAQKLRPEELGSSFALTEDDVADLMPGLREPEAAALPRLLLGAGARVRARELPDARAPPAPGLRQPAHRDRQDRRLRPGAALGAGRLDRQHGDADRARGGGGADPRRERPVRELAVAAEPAGGVQRRAGRSSRGRRCRGWGSRGR